MATDSLLDTKGQRFEDITKRTVYDPQFYLISMLTSKIDMSISYYQKNKYIHSWLENM